MTSTSHTLKNLSDWLQWLETLHPVEIDLGLERVRLVAKKLGLLAHQAKVISVAGTNGKGSCVETLRQILLCQGKRVGAYTSPHLLQFNERIAINHQLAGDEALCGAFAEIDEARADTSLTYFEFATLAALLLFKQHNLEYWLLEVGLGGRLDAVNIVDADIAVITSIDLDHEQWLGDSREKIALEKAGITRRGGQLVLAESDEPESLRDFIARQELQCYRYKRDFDLQEHEQSLVFRNGHVVEIQQKPQLPLASMAAALKVAELLNSLPDTAALAQCFATLRLRGRGQILQYRNRTLTLDVAHNPAASRLLARHLQAKGKRVRAIVALMRDKNIAGILAPLVPLVAHWCCCHLPENARAAPAETLRDVLLELGVAKEGVSLHATPADALVDATQYNQADILVFGSFYTVENILKKIEGEQSG